MKSLPALIFAMVAAINMIPAAIADSEAQMSAGSEAATQSSTSANTQNSSQSKTESASQASRQSSTESFRHSSGPRVVNNVSRRQPVASVKRINSNKKTVRHYH